MTIYLDHAATSWPKPPEVLAELTRFYREDAANPGRGGHAMARRAEERIRRCRLALAELIGAPAERVAFTSGATAAINTALFGLGLAAGERVLTGPLEHNAVARPLRALESRGVVVEVLPGDRIGRLSPEVLAAALDRGPARLLCINHGSNVNGAVQDLAALSKVARERGVLLLVDGAQTVGVLPIDVAALGIDLLAVPGHKSLLGPAGVGALYARRGLALAPLIYGGTGSRSESEDMPEAPFFERLEAGTVNAAGIAAWLEALLVVKAEDGAAALERERALAQSVIEAVESIPGARAHAALSEDPRGLAVIGLTMEGYEPAELAAVLDSAFDIATRGGLHCAPQAHRSLGTFPRGTVRVSPGRSTTEAEVAALIAALREIGAQT